jgi:2-polyprenyl-6-hydroxyphenyl methylase/3-demethylubiquinone-9 3-methyltransferase
MSSPQTPTTSPHDSHLSSKNSDSAEIAKFEASAHRFWDVDGEFKPLHKLNPVRARYVQERANLNQARALDVGCGGGLLAESLARAGAVVTAVDLAPTMIETGRLHALDSGLTIDYRVQSAEMLVASHAGKFDVVTCMEMLEHVPDPASTIEVLAKLARPGGDIFISTINRNFKSFALAIVGAEYLANLVPRGTHEYERLLKPSEIARFARAAGLEVVDIAGLKYDPVREQCSLDQDPSVNYLMHLKRLPAGRS